MLREGDILDIELDTAEGITRRRRGAFYDMARTLARPDPGYDNEAPSFYEYLSADAGDVLRWQAPRVRTGTGKCRPFLHFSSKRLRLTTYAISTSLLLLATSLLQHAFHRISLFLCAPPMLLEPIKPMENLSPHPLYRTPCHPLSHRLCSRRHSTWVQQPAAKRHESPKPKPCAGLAPMAHIGRVIPAALTSERARKGRLCSRAGWPMTTSRTWTCPPPPTDSGPERLPPSSQRSTRSLGTTGELSAILLQHWSLATAVVLTVNLVAVLLLTPRCIAQRRPHSLLVSEHHT